MTTSKRIAERYATTEGIVFEVSLAQDAIVINPCSVINEWLVNNQIWKGEIYDRAQEAMLLAHNDQEWLVFNAIPASAIRSVQNV